MSDIVYVYAMTPNGKWDQLFTKATIRVSSVKCGGGTAIYNKSEHNSMNDPIAFILA